jgi:hypothetical protein
MSQQGETMDEVDLAEKEINALTRIDPKKATELEAQATGKCLWCGDPVEGNRRWCCVECRDEWQRAQQYENLFKEKVYATKP